MTCGVGTRKPTPASSTTLLGSRLKILFGFSFGINHKAEVAVAEAKLLGHKIGRSGSSPDEERCQAVVDFPPLREKLHIQQFLGCANWLRGYLPAE